MKLTLLGEAKCICSELNDPLGIFQLYHKAERLWFLQNTSVCHICVLVNHKMGLQT